MMIVDPSVYNHQRIETASENLEAGQSSTGLQLHDLVIM